MHGTTGAAVTPSGYGGLITLADPTSVPEGASPRTYDTDFLVGKFMTRAGLVSAITFAEGSALGPDPGGEAVDVPTTGLTWANPNYVLADDGNYATVTLDGATSESLNIATVQVFRGFTGPVIYTITFASAAPAIQIGQTYTFSGLTSYTALNGSVLAAQSVSGNVVTFSQGFGTPFNYSYGPTADTGSAFISPVPPISPASDGIDITHFGFSAPSTDRPQGFEITIKGFASDTTDVYVQMLKNGVPTGTPEHRTLSIGSSGTVTLGGINDLFGTVWSAADLGSTAFGIRIWAVTSSSSSTVNVSIGYASMKVYIIVNSSSFQFVTTFVAQDGTVKNIYVDANGNLWASNQTTSPDVLEFIMGGFAPNSLITGINGPDVEYLTFSNGTTGSDRPIQYTANWIDPITQVGPAAAPNFAPVAATGNTFTILTITQPPQQSDFEDPGHFQTLQWSAGPTSTAPGNVITVFYSRAAHPDSDLINAFNSGNPVYVYVSTAPFGNGTWLVTSVGVVTPPGGAADRCYFTYQVPTVNYQQIGGPDTATGYYQRTLATMSMAAPVPALTVGNNATVTGASVGSWNTTWQISQAADSSSMAITGSQVTSSVATINYSVVTGAAPAAGQLVTITGLTNADGALNGVNQTIVSSTGGSTGTFTVNTSVITASFATEDGQATTAGTVFSFDPGALVVGTGTNPIYGNATGGTLTFTSASAQLIGPGTRQGTVFFITRNGYYTQPAPPAVFTCPENTTGVSVTNIPIGPPNVIARGISITEAGQLGVPGASFFYLPEPVDYYVSGIKYTTSSFVINDNTTTNVTLTFTDDALLNSRAIDIYGYNLFNQIEIGDPGWIASYYSRNFYGLCRNKVQNFNNLSFDGGYLPASTLQPLGWTQPDKYGSLVPSTKFGDGYYIQNTSGGTLGTAGLITQTAYQNYQKRPIILANTKYSVRVTARIPSSNTNGTLSITLTSGGVTYGSYYLPFASMTSDHQTFEGTLLTTPFSTVPASLLLNVSATNIANGADVEIDRIDIIYTDIPVLTTTVYGSYAGLPEQVDGVTGQVSFASENQQPVNGAMVMYDTFYGLKGWTGTAPGSSLYSLQQSPNLEPADWAVPEVAQRSGGAIGPYAFDLAEQWFLGAGRSGLYLFVGGQPGKINQEIYQVWDAINWKYGYKIWVKVDLRNRKIYCGVPMATPNFWLPNAPVNANPTQPNVILMCNYQGLDSGEEVKNMPQMHTTMFGTLNAIDMRRKWSIWQIASPFGNIVQGTSDEQFYICNGTGNSKVYRLDQNAETDDGAIIDSLYTTAGLVELSKRNTNPMYGNFRMRWGYFVGQLESKGTVNMRLLPNVLLGPADSTTNYNAWTLAGGFTPGDPALNDSECSLNFAATRTFIELRENDGHAYNGSNLVLLAQKDVWNAVRGAK